MPPPAATRSCSLERGDFGKGTSSRSTKLVHGGVRYLRQGQHRPRARGPRERGRLRRNAPHLVHDLAFVLPCYRWWEQPYYGVGLTAYDLLAGRQRFGRSQVALARRGARRGCRPCEPTACAAAWSTTTASSTTPACSSTWSMTAADHGARRAELRPGRRPHPRAGRADRRRDRPRRGERARVPRRGAGGGERGRAVLRRGAPAWPTRPPTPLVAAEPGEPRRPRPLVPARRLRACSCRETPRRPRAVRHPVARAHARRHDRRRRCRRAPVEPRPTDEEIDFILETAGRYLDAAADAGDVLSTFAGIRPLVKAGGGEHRGAVARPHDPRGCRRPADDHRRQVDDVPQHGRGRAWTAPRRSAGLPQRPCATARAADSTATTRTPAVRRRWPSTARTPPAIRRLIDVRPALGDAAAPGAAVHRRRRSSGRCGRRWPGRWRTCWPGGRGRCS